MSNATDGQGPSVEPPRRPRESAETPGASAFRVAVTRPREPAAKGREDRLVRLLWEVGLEPVHCPVLEISFPEDSGPLLAGISRLLAGTVRNLQDEGSTQGRWLVLTSRNAMPPILEALRAGGRGPGDLKAAGVRVAAVGSRTAAALRKVGLAPDLLPERFTAADLLRAFRTATDGKDLPTMAGSYVLFPRAEVAEEELRRGLEEMGARVEVVTAYRVEETPSGARRLARKILARELEAVTLTSGSAARSVARAWRQSGRGGDGWPPGVLVAAIGPVTAEAARREGLPVHLVPRSYTLEDLAKALAKKLEEEA
jgi:uroporphyrinogen III methyltransferase / synthase